MFQHIYLHIPKRLLRQFGYLKGIANDLIVDALAIVIREDINAIFAYYHAHLGLEDAHIVLASRP